MPPYVLRRTVETLVLPAALYALTTWSVCTKTQLHRIQKLQNWCARLISGRRKYDHIADVRTQLGWLRIEDESNYRLGVAAYSAKLGEMGADLEALFTNPKHRYDTRQKSAGFFGRPHVTSERGKKRFGYAGPTMLNNYADLVQRNLPRKKFSIALRDRIFYNGQQ